jgi:uncharacterized protein YndB with AHSA1/START domain
MKDDLLAKASITINAPSEEVWKALVNPEAIRQYMFGTHVISDWKEGSRIVWRGEWQGKPYEDKGVILTFKPERTLSTRISISFGFTGCGKLSHGNVGW